MRRTRTFAALSIIGLLAACSGSGQSNASASSANDMTSVSNFDADTGGSAGPGGVSNGAMALGNSADNALSGSGDNGNIMPDSVGAGNSGDGAAATPGNSE